MMSMMEKLEVETGLSVFLGTQPLSPPSRGTWAHQHGSVTAVSHIPCRGEITLERTALQSSLRVSIEFSDLS
jgi:hypothetical protein